MPLAGLDADEFDERLRERGLRIEDVHFELLAFAAQGIYCPQWMARRKTAPQLTDP